MPFVFLLAKWEHSSVQPLHANTQWEPNPNLTTYDDFPRLSYCHLYPSPKHTNEGVMTGRPCGVLAFDIPIMECSPSFRMWAV